jgi:hypothetical protein
MDSPHESFLTARATVGPRLVRRDPGGGFLGRVLSREGRPLAGAQELPAQGQLEFTLGVGQEPVATDPDEPLGQGMEEEPADELEGIQAEGPKTTAPCVILVAEREDPVLEGPMEAEPRISFSSVGESITMRSFLPLPCRTWMSMRSLSMSAGLSPMTSETRSPAA